LVVALQEVICLTAGLALTGTVSFIINSFVRRFLCLKNRKSESRFSYFSTMPSSRKNTSVR